MSIISHTSRFVLKLFFSILALFVTVSLGYTQLFRYSKITFTNVSFFDNSLMVLTQLPIDFVGNGTLWREFTFGNFDSALTVGKRTQVEFSGNADSSFLSQVTRQSDAVVLKAASNDIDWRLGYCTTSTTCFVSTISTKGSQALSQKSNLPTEVFGVDMGGRVIILTIESITPTGKLGTIPLL